MSDEVNFRKDALEEFFNKNKKSFLSILPLNSKINLLFFLLFLLFLILSFVFIKVPIKIDASGKVVSVNKDYHIEFNQDGYNVKDILKNEKEFVSKNDKIISLERSYSQDNNKTISNYTFNIETLENQIIDLMKVYKEQEKLMKDIYFQQKNITISLRDDYENRLKFKDEASINYENGLISKEYFNNSLMNLNDSKIKLMSSEQEEVKYLQYIKDYHYENNELISKIKSEIIHSKQIIINKKNELEPVFITSPCNCNINKISIQNGEIIKKNQIIAILNEESKKDDFSGILYIPTSHFGDIKNDSDINLKIESFPFLKYGTLKGFISYISNSPIISDNIDNSLFKESYYIIEVNITDIPDNIKLKDGMVINSHIIIKSVPLYQFLFEKF